MVNQEIVNYLNEGVKRGFEVSLLKRKLMEGGFKDKDVNEAVVVVNKNNPKQEVKREDSNNFEKKGSKKWIIILSIILVILIAAVIGVWFFRDQLLNLF